MLDNPVNLIDPLGLQDQGAVIVTGQRTFSPVPDPFGQIGISDFMRALDRLFQRPELPECSDLGATQCAIVVRGRRLRPKPPGIVIRGLWEDFLRGLRTPICSAPSLGGGAAVDMYAGAGATIAAGASVNPSTGQVSVGFDTGVGVGVGGGARISGGKGLGIGSPSTAVLPVVTAGLNGNATAVLGPVGATGSYQLIGSSPGDWSLGYAGGPDATVNANISGHVQFNLPPLWSGLCKG